MNSIPFTDVIKLDWSEANESFIQNHSHEIDLIVGADIIYDDSLFDSLLTTIRLLFNHCEKCEKFILINAIRNPQTEQTFLKKLCKLNYFSRKCHPYCNTCISNLIHLHALFQLTLIWSM